MAKATDNLAGERWIRKASELVYDWSAEKADKAAAREELQRMWREARK